MCPMPLLRPSILSYKAVWRPTGRKVVPCPPRAPLVLKCILFQLPSHLHHHLRSTPRHSRSLLRPLGPSPHLRAKAALLRAPPTLHQPAVRSSRTRARSLSRLACLPSLLYSVWQAPPPRRSCPLLQCARCPTLTRNRLRTARVRDPMIVWARSALPAVVPHHAVDFRGLRWGSVSQRAVRTHRIRIRLLRVRRTEPRTPSSRHRQLSSLRRMQVTMRKEVSLRRLGAIEVHRFCTKVDSSTG